MADIRGTRWRTRSDCTPGYARSVAVSIPRRLVSLSPTFAAIAAGRLPYALMGAAPRRFLILLSHLLAGIVSAASPPLDAALSVDGRCAWNTYLEMSHEPF